VEEKGVTAMQAFHIPGAAPLYTNTFLLISDAGHAVVIDPAADAQTYDKILKENNAQLTTILCTHGHYDHTGAVGELQAKWTETPVYLKVVVEKLTRTFYYSYDGQKWEKVGALENCIYLCDEGVPDDPKRHTGTLVGIYANTGGCGSRKAADFDYFKYED